MGRDFLRGQAFDASQSHDLAAARGQEFHARLHPSQLFARAQLPVEVGRCRLGEGGFQIGDEVEGDDLGALGGVDQVVARRGEQEGAGVVGQLGASGRVDFGVDVLSQVRHVALIAPVAANEPGQSRLERENFSKEPRFQLAVANHDVPFHSSVRDSVTDASLDSRIWKSPYRTDAADGKKGRRDGRGRASLCPPYARRRFPHGPLRPPGRLFRL
ncbi:hypothetical protein D3C80_1468120 [compost metagenome]